MQKVWLLLFLFVAVYAESQVRETETWMPIKSQTDGPQDEPVSSGDFGFGDDDDDEDTEYGMDDDDDEDDDDEDDFSGSGDGDNEMINVVPTKPDVIDNDIPDKDKPVWPKPKSNDNDDVWNNEVVPRVAAEQENAPPNVLMAHAGEEGVFSKPEVLAALIAGGAVGLLFAILLILLLIYRMKKKDEGSYDLGKKPIYTKAPTTEIYA
ncbi:syndecan-4 isoform X1 [Anguilla anguilla]|uniref:syndecan-4 isoform X1 n=1 Tax=Anguilla anguilla TaxID=7936 RepID=UPI0015AE70FA|nr:syndecan-4 isoform X1 [Anguilla anguilla]